MLEHRALLGHGRAVAVVLLFVLALFVLALQAPSPATGQADVVYQSGATAFGPTTGGGNCSSALGNETPPRTLADTLDDAWFGATAKTNLAVGLFPSADIGPVSNSYVLALPGHDVTVEIGKYDISPADAVSTTANSVGVIDGAGGTDPSLLTGSSEQMQDCAPKPLSLVSAAEGGPLAAPTPFWNAVGFAADRNTLDSVLFTFSRPVDNFGAWFGDLETRADDATSGSGDGGELATIKLYAADGSVLAVQRVTPNDQRLITSDTAGPGDPGFDDDGFGCGDQVQNDDFSSCGNHGTRFLGFAWSSPTVAAMQVIVGDDDHCVEVAACEGLTEHLSFIGPQMAFNPPQLTFEKVVNNDDGRDLGPSDFPLTLTEDPAGAAAATSHLSGDTVVLASGTTYEVSEAAVVDYDLSSLVCIDLDTALAIPVNFVPTNDQRIRCTFTNDDQPMPTTTTVPTTTVPTTTTAPSTTSPATTAPETTATPATIVPSTEGDVSGEATTSAPTAATTTTTPADGDVLPVTGAEVGSTAASGLVLIVLGAIALLFTWQFGRPQRAPICLDRRQDSVC